MNNAASDLCMWCMSPLGGYIVCPRCGYDNGAPHDTQHLKPGSCLSGRYITGRLVRKNGEGVLYTGYDQTSSCRVFIREYFPHTIADRDIATGNIHPKEGCGAQYKTLLSDFIDVCNDVKRLSVTEPVVPIENVLTEHNTVYAVYRDIDVTSLESYLESHGGKVTVSEAREMILPLLNTLSNIHARNGEIHRGISPATVYIDKDKNLYLWDFCMSATRTGGSELEAELFHGYSAPEQYASNGWQGTWTDVYAVGALFYRMVSGFAPPKSTTINEQRPLAPLTDLVMDIPVNVSDAVAQAMSVPTEIRTQEIGAFTAQILETNISNTAVYDTALVNEVKKRREVKRQKRLEKRRRGKYMALGLLVTVLILGTGAWGTVNYMFPHLINRGQAADIQTSYPDSEDSEESSENPADKAMPDLVGQQAVDVVASAEYKARFEFVPQYEFNEAPEGIIYDQKPSAGVPIEDDRTVFIYISKGTQIVTMPDLKGMDRDQVAAAMDKIIDEIKMSLPNSEFTTNRPDEEPGKVVMTVPAAGTEFDPRETTIQIIYNSWDAKSSSESESNQDFQSGSENPQENSDYIYYPDDGTDAPMDMPYDAPVDNWDVITDQYAYEAADRPLVSDFEQQFYNSEQDRDDGR